MTDAGGATGGPHVDIARATIDAQLAGGECGVDTTADGAQRAIARHRGDVDVAFDGAAGDVARSGRHFKARCPISFDATRRRSNAHVPEPA